VLFMQQGMPMTFQSATQVSTLEPERWHERRRSPKQQTIVVGSVAAVIPIKQIGTNGGGFYGPMRRIHSRTRAFGPLGTCIAMMLFPSSFGWMFGRMLRRMRHGVVIYAVWHVVGRHDRLGGLLGRAATNPGLSAHAAIDDYAIPSASAPNGAVPVAFPAVAGLPSTSTSGILEGAELRFGTTPRTFAALTTPSPPVRQSRARQPDPLAACRDDRYVAELRVRPARASA